MRALLIVDMQNDFMPQGPLGVKNADALVAVINALIPQFPLVVASQDWHPPDHVSFAASHSGKRAGDHIRVNDTLDQVLWAVHCVRNTPGAELVAGLDKDKISCCFFKGTDSSVDSYSAFFDNARSKSTGLGDYLKSRGVTDLYLVGVATDYCVLYSALDAIALGFTVHVIADACLPINLDPRDEERALSMIAAQGGKIESVEKKSL